jgi:DNA (cytosine-5)-methyltransferase 1
MRVSRGRRQAFTFVDLFAGIGGIRLGLQTAGGTCAYSVEIDRFARTTYEANFGRCEGTDIKDVDQLPPHDVLAGGFPCQPFSIAGVSKNLSLGRQHGFQHARQGNLFFDVARLIATSRPRALFLENVKNLMSHDRGRTFEVIRATLEDLGYNVTNRVVDARYWVPQHRERTFIIGLNRDYYGEQRFVFPDPPVSAPVLGSILEAEAPRKYVLSQHLWDYLQAYAEKHRQRGNGFGFGLVGPDSVARTLSARYHKDGSEILVRTCDGPPRRLTPRECARLMGFPEDFRIVVSDTQAYHQFGNAVVVPVITVLAHALTRQINLRIPEHGGDQMAFEAFDTSGRELVSSASHPA